MEVEDPITPIMAITPVTPTDDNEPPTSEEQPNKRRRKKSIVWEHFTIETVGAGCMRACCKQCKKSFAYITGSKLAGTSHLKRHISLGICPVSRQKNEASTPGSKTDPPKKRYRASPGFSGIPFDQERCNHDIAKMIIQHDYPLHIVEHPAFIDFVRTLQPQYNMVSFNTIQGECVAVYLREKQSLLNLISEIPGRVSLTLDLGSSNLNIGYAILTGHFIDADWNLQRRILNVAMVPFPDADFAFNQAVVSCLSDWHLENKLFTVTLDQSFSNETIVGNLRGHLSVKNPFVLNGQLLKGNCYARILSRLAQDLLGATGEIVKRIRESVKYVKTSEAHDEKFTELRQQLQVPSTKDLIIDDQTKWNTTYQMLVAACELKEVFACLDTSDPVYKINPSVDDWKKVEILCSYLKLLYDAASILTSPTYPPAHVFYHEVYKIQLELTHHAASHDPFVSKLTKPLKVKFDQYWKECFLVLATAVVMDPRFKMKLLEFSFPKVFGEDAGMWIKVVDDGIHELFLDYLAPNLHVPATFVEEGQMDIPQPDTPQKVEPAQDEHSQGVPPQEAVPPQVPLQVVHPEKATPQEAPLQDDHHQEASLQELHPQEQEVASQVVPSQETHTEVLASQEVSNHEIEIEVSCQAAPPEEMHTEQVPSREVSNHEIKIEVSSQEVVPKEMHLQEATPQVTQSEEVPYQEMHALEAPPQEKQSEEVPSQEVPPEQMQTKEVPSQEAPTQDIHTEEVPSQELPPQEIQPEVPSEEVPVQKMGTEEVLPSREVSNHEIKIEVSSQEVVPKEMHLQEATPQVTQAEEVPSQAMHALEAPPQEKLSEEVLPHELPPEQMQTKEVPSQEAPTQDSHAEEAPSQEFPPQEIQPDVPSEEVPVQKMETEEVPPQERQTEEVPPQEMETKEVPPQERQREEVPPQERQTEEVPPQEMQTEEVPPQEMQTEEVPPQEMQMEEVPPQDMQTEELPPQEMHSEVLPEEMQLQVIHQEMQPQELHTQDLPMLTIGDGLSDFDIYISEISSGQHLKSELDQYLEESLLPRVHEFDVLGWWKLNRLKYPTLSKMAADILSIPISTVAPDSVFDTENRKIDSYRSALRPVTLEALICAKDWLQYGSSSSSISQEVSNAIVKREF